MGVEVRWVWRWGGCEGEGGWWKVKVGVEGDGGCEGEGEVVVWMPTGAIE